MKIYKTDELKNVVLLGNAGSGKTILAESMLFNGKVITRRGEINNKNTASDYRDIEHEQGGSVLSTVLYSEWNGKKINIIDAPGSDDFIGSAYAGFYAAENGVLVINAQNGVEVGTEIIARHIKKTNKPTVIALNQLDHEKANYEKSIEDAKTLFGGKLAVVQYPTGTGDDFNAVIDVLKMKMYKWTDESGVPQELDIPAEEKDKAVEYQEQLVESAAENDDSLMELFFENGTLTEDEMRKGLNAGINHGTLLPLFCISAKKNIGVSRLMDFITATAPSPCHLPAQEVDGQEINFDETAPTSLFFFKSSHEQHLGEVLYFKVMSGVLKEAQDLTNMNRQSKERVSQLYVVAGKNREKVSELKAGDIGATVKLKETKVNHTLNDKGAEWIFPEMDFPNSKYRAAIRAENEADEEKLSESLNKIREEDPTIILEYSKELKQLIIHGQGEYHLNLMVKWQLDHIYKIPSEFITPKIPYRETITKAAQSMYRHKKQSGGAGQFGEVHMIIEPFVEGAPDPKTFKIQGREWTVNVRDKQEFELDWGGKLIFYNCIVGGVIDARFQPAILKGVMDKIETGPLTGCYARDIRICVYDGKMHPVDSNEISFKIAGAKSFSDAFKNAGAKIMEPVYDVEVLVPSDKMGDVMSDLQGRRAIIQGMSSEGGYEKITTRVPLAEMSKYSTALSSLTNGRANYTMSFAEYAPVPGDVQEDLLKAYAAEQEEE